jgi:hypothetical protein
VYEGAVWQAADQLQATHLSASLGFNDEFSKAIKRILSIAFTNTV